MTVDVVVVTWHSRERVLRCLERLTAEATEQSIVAVDNASRDGTVEGIRARFPAVAVLELPANRGFGAAVNAAVAERHGDAIVLVNDDVEVEPGFLGALLAPLDQEPRCAMVAGVTTIPDQQRIDGFGIELDTTLAAYNRMRRDAAGHPGILAMPSGGFAAYRRTAFEQVGGFDETLLAYGEDVDIGLRLRLAGWSAVAAPAARGVHVGAASVGRHSALQRELAGFARGFLLRRYGVLRTRAALRTLIFETLVVGWGLVRHQTLIPLRGRIRGWRAAGTTRLPIPPDAIDHAIGWRETLRRLRAER